jgi:hypothetical protein
MVLEIDTGVWVETRDMSSVTLQPGGNVIVVVDGVPYESTRFSFENLLTMLQQREAQTVDVAY